MNLMRQPMNRSAGFTLMELITTVAILGVLAAMAAPSMAEMVAKQRVKSTASELYLALMRARSEAIKRNADIILSPAPTWAIGWSIPNPADSANPIASYSAPKNAVITGPTSVTFTSSGRVRGSAGVSFAVSSTGTTTKHCVSLDLSGRATHKATEC
jgi:type IV fimbrial biogenesis protein FimT